MNINEYKDLFLAEAQEYLQLLNTALLDLEQDPDNRDIIQEMFRAAHSLKGMSATMGFQTLAGLTHQMENVLDLLRCGNLQADKTIANLLFQALDLLENLLERIDEPDAKSSSVNKLIDKFRLVCKSPQENQTKTKEEDYHSEIILDELQKQSVQDALSLGQRVRVVEIKLDSACLLKSVRAYMVIKCLGNIGSIIITIPTLQEIDDEQFENSFSAVIVTTEEDSALQTELLTIAEVEEVSFYDLHSLPEVREQKPAKAPLSLAEDKETKNKKENNGTQATGEQQHKSLKRTSENTIRVETEKLDKLVNLVGELVVNRTRVVELGKTEIGSDMTSAMEQLDRITTELQNAVMKLRMVPVKQVFDRLPRMVRDLSQEKGKKVDLLIIGEETELDRSIVNQIGNPLVHLLRNSVDHGVETPSERVSLGKQETAVIELEARHEGSHVLIRVTDDGRGIDASKIRQSAVKKGIMTAAEANHLSDEDALRLIFRNGFSTAEQVSSTSGRGVGMDAVQTVIESMSGSIDLKTSHEEGSSILIRLPLTLAIIKALLVGVGGEIYAIPIEAIRENLFVPIDEVRTIQGDKVINLRNQVLPLIFLNESLGLGSMPEDDVFSVVVVEVGDRKAGLIVDTLLGQQEIVIKSLSRVVEGIHGVAGATVLGSGRVALILDIPSLL